MQVAEAPSKTWRVISLVTSGGRSHLLAAEQRFDGSKGFQFSDLPGEERDLEYLLLNRYDGDLGSSVSELWDLRSQQLVHRWEFSGIDAVWRGPGVKDGARVAVDASSRRFRNVHSLLDARGGLVTQMYTPLVRADICSNLELFENSAIYHHSFEFGPEGHYWGATRFDPKSVELGSGSFADDGLAHVSPEGEVLFNKSVVQILEDNGLAALIYGSGIEEENDPIHLNDIEPVRQEGRFWKKGDVFLSLRHQSMIILYRPATNRIVWFKQGPWVHQHDVNVLNDHQISVFNNNAYRKGVKENVVRGVNEVLIYDFDTGAVTSPWRGGFEKLQIRTITEGRGTPISDELFVEETNFGRALQFDAEGRVTWQYVNRASDGKVYLLNWSRLVSRELGDQVRMLVNESNCR